MGLNDAYEDIRSDILSMEPLLAVSRVFMALQIERGKCIITSFQDETNANALVLNRNF